MTAKCAGASRPPCCSLHIIAVRCRPSHLLVAQALRPGMSTRHPPNTHTYCPSTLPPHLLPHTDTETYNNIIQFFFKCYNDNVISLYRPGTATARFPAPVCRSKRTDGTQSVLRIRVRWSACARDCACAPVLPNTQYCWVMRSAAHSCAQ